jgi:hypothetical protein
VSFGDGIGSGLAAVLRELKRRTVARAPAPPAIYHLCSRRRDDIRGGREGILGSLGSDGIRDGGGSGAPHSLAILKGIKEDTADQWQQCVEWK